MLELDEEVNIFLIEARENLEAIEHKLIELENAPDDLALVHEIFRCIHTIKGSCSFLGFKSIESLCHRGETVFDLMRNGKLTCTPNIINTLLNLVDNVNEILVDIESSGSEQDRDVKQTVADLDAILG